VEVRPVLQTNDRVSADTACDVLRAHGIKCDLFEPDMPIRVYPGPKTRDWKYLVVVAVGDEGRAQEILAGPKQ
jgi:hypothetical protein